MTSRKSPNVPHPAVGSFFLSLPMRLAQGDPEYLREHLVFHRKLRKLLRISSPTPAETVDLETTAFEVMNDIERLNLSRNPSANDPFRLELLRHLADRMPTPRLLMQLLNYELLKNGTTVVPGHWTDSLRSIDATDVPRLESQGGLTSPFLNLSAEAARAAARAVDLAAAAMASGALASWTESECALVVRILIVHSLFGQRADALPNDVEPYRLSSFEGIGLGLWKALRAQALKFEPAPENTGLWDEAFQAKVLLLLRSRAEEAKLRSTKSKSVSRSAKGAALDPEQATLEGLGSKTRRIELPDEPGTLIVARDPIPPAQDKVDAQALEAYELLRAPLPVTPVPSPEQIEQIISALAAEFPWAGAAVEHTRQNLSLAALLGVQELQMPHTLLVGPPGCGKSRFVRRLAQHLQMPYLPIPLGGASDSKLLTGTSRGWGCAEASPFLRNMVQHKSASAFVLLDEVDKISRQDNGRSLDGILLGLLESETATRWRDGFLQVSCDLSKLVFWGTANSLEAVSKPLLSRTQLVLVPSPRPEDASAIAAGMVADLEEVWRLPHGTLPEVPAHICFGGVDNLRSLKASISRYLLEWAREHRDPRRMH